MDLLIVWFTKFNTQFSLERSQEDMFKCISEVSVSCKMSLEFGYL